MNAGKVGVLSARNVVDGSSGCTKCRHILEQDQTPLATALSVNTRAAEDC